MKTKRKSGFTLLELLGTITILSVVAVITIVIITNVNDKAKDKGIQISEANVLLAGNGYVNEFDNKIQWTSNTEETMTCVTVKELVEQGYLKEDTIDGNYEGYSIKVIKHETKVNEYIILKTNDCKITDTKAPIISCNNNTNIEIKTSHDIETGVILDGTGSKIVKKEITLNNNPIANTDNLGLGIYQINYKIEDEGGNVANKNCQITIIDSNKPTISLTQDPTTSSTSWVNNSVKLTGKATDNGSGIIAYQFSTTVTPNNSSWKNYETAQTSIIETLNVSEKGKWYFHVKDGSGNISSKEIEVYTDNTAPVFQNSTGSFTSSSGILVYPTANFTDEGSGVKEVKYYVTTSTTKPEKNNISFSLVQTVSVTYGTTYYVYAIATDNAGNVSEVASLDKYTVYGTPVTPSIPSCGCYCNAYTVQACMLNNSNAWLNTNNTSYQDYLHQQNQNLANYANSNFGTNLNYQNTGIWYNNGNALNP